MELVVRSTVIFFFLFAVTRGLGRKELSQLSAFDLILFVIMGDVVQQGITQEDMSLTGNALAVATIAAAPAWSAVAIAGYPYFFAVLLDSPHAVAIGRVSYGLALVVVIVLARRATVHRSRMTGEPKVT